MSLLSTKKLTEVIAGVFILLFTYTAINKLVAPKGLAYVLKKTTALPNFANELSYIIPITELAVCVLLFIPALRRRGLLASLGLMILFTVYIGYMLLTVSNLPCSCGGVLRELTWMQHLFFNLFFTGLAAYGLSTSKLNKHIFFTSFLRKKQGTPKTCINE
jgi:hypothetical protein